MSKKKPVQFLSILDLGLFSELKIRIFNWIENFALDYHLHITHAYRLRKFAKVTNNCRFHEGTISGAPDVLNAAPKIGNNNVSSYKGASYLKNRVC